MVEPVNQVIGRISGQPIAERVLLLRYMALGFFAIQENNIKMFRYFNQRLKVERNGDGTEQQNL